MHLQWKHFMMLGMRTPDTKLQERKAEIQANKCCSIIYTVSSSSGAEAYRLSAWNRWLS